MSTLRMRAKPSLLTACTTHVAEQGKFNRTVKALMNTTLYIADKALHAAIGFKKRVRNIDQPLPKSGASIDIT